LKAALAGDDDEAVKTAYDKLNESQQKLGQAIYSAAQASEAPAGDAGEAGAQGEGSSSDDEDVIDAEVVEDEEKK